MERGVILQQRRWNSSGGWSRHVWNPERKWRRPCAMFRDGERQLIFFLSQR